MVSCGVECRRSVWASFTLAPAFMTIVVYATRHADDPLARPVSSERVEPQP
jgi:hypothetical protein